MINELNLENEVATLRRTRALLNFLISTLDADRYPEDGEPLEYVARRLMARAETLLDMFEIADGLVVSVEDRLMNILKEAAAQQIDRDVWQTAAAQIG